MTDQIKTATRIQFADSYRIMAQQMMSKFEDKVHVEPIDGLLGYIDYLGLADEPDAQTAYVMDTVFSEVPHGRRQVICTPYNKAFPLDEAALKRIIADPSGDYVNLLRAATNRMLDRRMMLAAIGNSTAVSTDLMTTTNVALPATQIAAETGTLGMTLFKLGLATSQFNLNDVDPMFERWLAVSPLGLDDLLFEPEIQLSTVNQLALEAVRNGEVKKLFGFNIVMSNYLPKTGNIRSNVAWVREGLAMGFNQSYYAVIENRPDKWGLKQIRGHIDVGFTRMQETHVFALQAYEDPSRGATPPQ